MPWSGSGPRYWTEYRGFDALDRPASQRLPNGSQLSGLEIFYRYTGSRTDIQVGTDSNYAVYRIKNALGQWVEVQDQGSEDAGYGARLTTHFRYDAAGNPAVISRTPLGGSEVRNTARYNNVGHKLTMSDPERGSWNFAYNVLGELSQQSDAKGDVTALAYDLLGRPLSRHENGVQKAQWVYDADALPSGKTAPAGCSTAIGQPRYASKLGEAEKYPCYQSNGLIIRTETRLTPAGEAAKTFTVTQSWDTVAPRPLSQTWPSGQLTVSFRYNALTGQLDKLTDAATGKRIEETLLQDAFGNLEQSSIGDSGTVGVTQFGGVLYRNQWFDDATGRLTGLCTQVGSSCTVLSAGTSTLQALDYGQGSGTAWYNTYGNLSQQKNTLNGVTENFQYDRRQRLTQSLRSKTGAPNQTANYGYNQLGNLLQKTDYAQTSADLYSAPAMKYGSQAGTGYKPHQVGRVTLRDGSVMDYVYDANGNQTDSNKAGASWRRIAYNLQMVPTSVTRGSNSSRFDYDEGNERYFEKHLDGSKTTRVWKLGKLFEHVETTTGSTTSIEQKHYAGQHGLLSYYPGNGTRRWHWLLQDRLGSVDTVTAAATPTNVATIEHHGFDAFGKPRTADWLNDTKHATLLHSALLGLKTSRGFTGHDHVDGVGLIHMNGRAYDPELGRFTGVDPLMQAPLNSQSLNPYSYIMNNPIAGTDPTGYSAKFSDEDMAAQVDDISVNKKGDVTINATRADGSKFTHTVKNGEKGFSQQGAAKLAGKLEGQSTKFGDVSMRPQVGGAAGKGAGGEYAAPAGGASSAARSADGDGYSEKGSADSDVANTTQAGAAPTTQQNFNSDIDDDGVEDISFVNDNPNGPSTDLPVDNELVEAVEVAVNAMRIHININSTSAITPEHPAGSTHANGFAVDINEFNGTKIWDKNLKRIDPYVANLITEFASKVMEHPSVNIVITPRLYFIRQPNGEWKNRPRSEAPAIYNIHRNHVHVQVSGD